MDCCCIEECCANIVFPDMEGMGGQVRCDLLVLGSSLGKTRGSEILKMRIFLLSKNFANIFGHIQ